MPSVTTYTKREELANAMTHGMGIGLSVIGLILMVVYSALYGNAWHVSSTAIFGSTLIALYTTSTLYHSFHSPELKRMLRKLDHAAIFLLIAGSYTPFLLVSIRDTGGWSLFYIIWAFAFTGVGLKFKFAGRFRVLSTLIYLGMGWLVVVVAIPLIIALPPAGLFWLAAGGVSYSFGTIFYLAKRLKYHHAVWHLFVLGGSICHWIAVFFYVIPH